MSVLEALEKGLKFHEENKWCRGTPRRELKNGEFAYCATGALYYSDTRIAPCDVWCLEECNFDHEEHSDNKSYFEAFSALTNAVTEAYPGIGGWGIISFNDGFAKRKRDITRIFKQAIKTEREKVNA